MAKNNKLLIGLVIAGLILFTPLRAQLGIDRFFAGFGGGGVATTGSGISTSGVCLKEDVSFISDDARKNLLGTNPGLNYRLFIGSSKTADLSAFPTGFVDKGATTDAASVTVPTETPYVAVAGWNSGTDGLVYRKLFKGNTDCDDPLSLAEVWLAYGDQNLTMYLTDEDGSLNALTTGVFNASAGTDFSFTPTVSAGSDFYWGNPYISGNKNILVVQYNSTLYDGIKISSLQDAPMPDIARNNGTGWNRKAFYMPSLTSTKYSFKVDADVKSGSTFLCQTHHQRNNIYLEFYDANVDLNADDNTLIEGVEDEDNNQLGAVDSLNRFREAVGC